MKRIFHSMAQDCIDPEEFLVKANQALVKCLESDSFISPIIFLVNTTTRVIRYARGGHCPVLYYHATTDRVEYFKDKGVALGMIRSNAYRNFARTEQFSFSPGDVMVLYTDGITEAKNSKGEEFGYDRLAAILAESKHLSAREIQDR